MNKLNDIILENIKYFWENDTITETETEETTLWEAFKLWCIPNCMEIFEDIDQSVIGTEIEKHFITWKQLNTK